MLMATTLVSREYAVDMKARIRQFVQGNFFVNGALDDGTSLLDKGIIDSTGVLEVIGFIETEFGISVADEEMLPENLDSIAAIAGYVERKRAAA